MRKFTLIFLCLFLMFPSFVYAEDKGEKISPPQVAAGGAVLMDAQTGRVLWGKNEHEPMAMASTTKIMTAIVTLESGKMYDTVTVSQRAANAPKVKMFLSPGEQINMYKLLQALMLESSNDAAVAIAEHIGGSVEAFCTMMTVKAHELGATDTLFVTPNGLDAGEHHSTAYDMALITRYALTVPGFTDLTNKQSAEFSSSMRSYSVVNKNRLLHEYQGANGVKTGFTNKAGHCFVGAARRNGMQLISVVLASGWGDKGRNQKWIDTKEILNFGFNNYEYETLVTFGDVAGEVPVTRSRDTAVDYSYAANVVLPLNKDEKAAVAVTPQVPESVRAPIAKGDSIGRAEVSIGGLVYTNVPLVASEEASRHDLKTSVEKVLNAWLDQSIKKAPRIVLPEALEQ